MFCSLHNHTYASNIRFLDSINRPEDMINKALELNFSGMAFTDHESLSAAVSIIKIRDNIKKEHPEFKIIFGNEIYLIDEKEIKNANKYYHFILLAKDATGWQQLKELSSRAWNRGYMEKGILRVPTTYRDIEEVVGQNPGHIIAGNACIGGYLDIQILEHNVKEANKFAQWCINIFGKENFYFEMQAADSEEQIACNKVLLKFAKHYNVPYTVTTDSHYINKEDFAIHSAFLNSKQSTDRETEKFYKYTYIMTETEMRELLYKSDMTDEEIDIAFNNSVNICNQIQEFDFRHQTIVPKIKIPEFNLKYLMYHKGYRTIDQFYEDVDEQNRYLMYQLEEGFSNKHINITPEKLERIETELDILDHISKNLNQSLSSYLNLTKNIVDIAWQVSLTGTGRGSACGFYINYLLGITQVDPLEYDLPYWRFLNKERVELPDIDEDFQPEKTEDIVRLLREAYGEDSVLNCATFKTESLKSAILSCGRGLGYNYDDMQALAAMVPAHRGKTYTLKQCLEGDEEQGFDPVPDFEKKINAYPGLMDAVKKIEGLPTNASIHASALYIFNDGYLPQNSLMRAPNGTKMTAFNMHDSDDMGALKMDVLRTDAQSKMAKCLNLLLSDKQIEWQGSLRKTYDKYIHPDVLDYQNPKMWEKMANGEISNLFQFETQVGSTCIKKARPTNVRQLAEINSIMRLQVEGNEQPIDRYVRFRKDINEWYKEMTEATLTQHEQDVLRKYLEASYGVSGSQEVLMRILMDPEITHFTLGEANAARKAIAKKIAKKLIQLKKDFYEKGANTRKEFLDYVWKTCIEPQLGYSFSLNHTLPYSVIAVQEANLATRWNPLYWQCACLCINAGNSSADFDEQDDEEEITETVKTEEETEEIEKVEIKTKRAAPNYGKIAKAIADAQLSGVKIELPDINEAQLDFIPDIKNNAIIYSLQAVNVVNDDLLDRIFEGRPYSSIEDFYERVQPTQSQMIGLIKAGCFDKLYREKRTFIMSRFLNYLADKNCPKKEKLTTVHLKKAIELGLNLEKYAEPIRVYKFKRYIDNKEHGQIDTATRRYILTDPSCLKFFNTFIEPKLNLVKGDYSVFPDNVTVKISALEKVYKAYIEDLMNFLNSDEGKDAFQQLEKDQFIQELQEKYCKGSVAAWEMETLCFYHEPHELSTMNSSLYNTQNFETLPEIPEVRTREINGKVKNIYNLCTLAGTVTNTDNTKHIVSISTLYGVVNIKFYAGLYNQFNSKISVVDSSTKKKTVIDDSWFKRGNKIIVHGMRRENMFMVKTDYTSGYSRTVGLIEDVRPDGSLGIRYTRNKK